MLRSGDRVLELPQYVYMRAALDIHGANIDKVIQTYDALSRQLYLHPPQYLRVAGTSEAAYPTAFIYEPPPTLSDLLASTTDIDTIWDWDSEVGISLGGVPATR